MAGVRPCSAQMPLSVSFGSRASSAAFRPSCACCHLGGDLAQLRNAWHRRVPECDRRRRRRIEELHLVGQLDFCFGSTLNKRPSPNSAGLQLRARYDHPLLLVLQLHIGAQRVDAGAHAVLLQIGRLVVERLRQVSRDCAASTSAAARWQPRYCETTSSTLSPAPSFPARGRRDTGLRSLVAPP